MSNIRTSPTNPLIATVTVTTTTSATIPELVRIYI